MERPTSSRGQPARLAHRDPPGAPRRIPQNDFRPEFFNRVDEILLFRTLTRVDYTTVAGRYLRRFFDRLGRERQIEVILDPGVNDAIGAYCAELNEGARAVHRLARSMVILPVIRHALRAGEATPLRLLIEPAPDAVGEPMGPG